MKLVNSQLFFMFTPAWVSPAPCYEVGVTRRSIFISLSSTGRHWPCQLLLILVDICLGCQPVRWSFQERSNWLVMLIYATRIVLITI